MFASVQLRGPGRCGDMYSGPFCPGGSGAGPVVQPFTGGFMAGVTGHLTPHRSLFLPLDWHPFPTVSESRPITSSSNVLLGTLFPTHGETNRNGVLDDANSR